MNADEIHFGLSTVLSLIFGSGRALSVFFVMRGSIRVLQEKVKNLEEDQKTVNKRVDGVKEEVRAVKDFTNKVSLDISKMETRIVREIHDLFKRQNKGGN